MYKVTAGIQVDIQKSSQSVEYFYILGGQVYDDVGMRIYNVLPTKVYKIPNETNYIYFNCVSYSYIVTRIPFDITIYPGILLGNYTVSYNGVVTDYQVSGNLTTETIVPTETLVVNFSGAQVVKTDENLIVENNEVVLSLKPTKIINIYVLNEGDLDNPYEVIVSITDNTITFLSYLNGKQLDITFQAWEL